LFEKCGYRANGPGLLAHFYLDDGPFCASDILINDKQEWKMKRTLLSMLVALASVTLWFSVASAAPSDDPKHPYLNVQVGRTLLQDASVRFQNPGFFNDEIEFDSGYNVSAAFGYDYGRLRLEVELAHRRNEVNNINNLGRSFRADGDISATSLMLNGYRDFATGSRVVPYLGGGIGVANVSANKVKLFDVTGEVAYIDDDDTVFAYHLATGVAFTLSPTLTLDLGYRFFGTSNPQFDDDLALIGIQTNGLETEYHSHNISVGLRIKF
jgi:opacity protein-like surface antigen